LQLPTLGSTELSQSDREPKAEQEGTLHQ